MTQIFVKIPQKNKECDIFKLMAFKCLLCSLLLLLLFAVKPRSVIICEDHTGIISCPNGK